MTDTALIVFIAVCTMATFVTRVLPFIALSRQADHPLILHLGRYLPPTVMAILVIYSLRHFTPWDSGQFDLSPNGLPLLLASLTVVGLHLWRRNALLSIIGGTGLYMILIQVLWP